MLDKERYKEEIKLFYKLQKTEQAKLLKKYGKEKKYKEMFIEMKEKYYNGIEIKNIKENNLKSDKLRKIIFNFSYLIIIIDIILILYVIYPIIISSDFNIKLLLPFFLPFFMLMSILRKQINGVMGYNIIHIIIYGAFLFSFGYYYLGRNDSLYKIQFYLSIFLFIFILIINLIILKYIKKNKISFTLLNEGDGAFNSIGKLGEKNIYRNNKF